jgi:hypothetical protein
VNKRPDRVTSTVATITAIGLVWRLIELASHTGVDPDAVEYRRIALAMAHPLDTAAREPAWPVAVRVWTWFTGADLDRLRILSLIAAVVLIPATYLFARHTASSRRIGVVACVVVAVHPGLIDHAVRGLRGEFHMLGLIAFGTAVLAPTLTQRWRIGLLVAGAALLLNTILSATVLVATGLVIVAVTRRLPWRHAAICGACVVAVIAPHLIRNQVVYDDPMYTANIHAVWYRNHEFLVTELDTCDGCPTLPEWGRNNYAGTQVTWAEYLFDYHSVGTVVSRTIDGTATTLLLHSEESAGVLGRGGVVVYLVYVAGLVATVWRRRFDVIVFLAAALGGTAFMVPTFLDFRLLLPLAPLMALVVGVGVDEAWNLTERLRRRRVDRADGSSAPHRAATDDAPARA